MHGKMGLAARGVGKGKNDAGTFPSESESCPEKSYHTAAGQNLMNAINLLLHPSLYDTKHLQRAL